MMIRKGKKEDLSAVLDLVHELAIFEKEPEAVVTNLEEYIKSYEEKLIDFYVAEVEGKVAGMALYYYIFSTWKGKSLYLEDFVVKSEFRSHGLGQQLFDAVIDVAKTSGCRDMRWQVLDWNKDAIRFYEKNNCIFLKDWWNGRIIF
jgi:GNAT superfamily N-acetyltransferase